MNHFSTRAEKIVLLQLLHRTSLPPLSSKFEELNNSQHLCIQFSKMMKAEVAGTSFKWGGAIPACVLEWLDEEWQEAFLLLRGQNYEKPLKQVLLLLLLQLLLLLPLLLPLPLPLLLLLNILSNRSSRILASSKSPNFTKL